MIYLLSIETSLWGRWSSLSEDGDNLVKGTLPVRDTGLGHR